MEIIFKVGDVVYLNSGSIPMTVTQVSESLISVEACVGVSEACPAAFIGASFPPEALNLYRRREDVLAQADPNLNHN